MRLLPKKKWIICYSRFNNNRVIKYAILVLIIIKLLNIFNIFETVNGSEVLLEPAFVGTAFGECGCCNEGREKWFGAGC